MLNGSGFKLDLKHVSESRERPSGERRLMLLCEARASACRGGMADAHTRDSWESRSAEADRLPFAPETAVALTHDRYANLAECEM